MHSSYNLIKNSNASINGGVEIITDYSKESQEISNDKEENNILNSYEIIGSRIISKARSDAETIMVEALYKAKEVEKEAYTKGYEQGINNGYEDGSIKGYEEAISRGREEISTIIEKANEILRSAENTYKEYKNSKKNEIINLALEMAKVISKKEFEADESILNLINPVMEACRAEENLIIRCNSNYVASVESKVKVWKNTYSISGEILVLEDPIMELGNAVIEKSTGKITVGIDVTLKNIEEALEEFIGE